MKLILTALIDFNHSQESDQNASEKFNSNAEVLRLIQPDTLLDEIADANAGDRPNSNDFYQNVFPATLKFSDQDFRQHYLNWIYSNYSHSMVNQRRIRRIEHEVIVHWAKQFNQRHTHLKITKLATEITDLSLNAKLWIIGYGRRLNRSSFDFQNALGLEYHQDYRLSFYNFELDESRQLAASFDTIFNIYMPNANFRFFNNAPSYDVVDRVQPLRFNPDMYQIQQKRSASAVENKLQRAQSAYHSVAAQANSFADKGSQIVSSLKTQTSSALHDYSGVSSQLSAQANENASLSSANVSLQSRINSLSTAALGSGKAIEAYKRSKDSLQNQVNGLKNDKHFVASTSAQINSLRSSMSAKERDYQRASESAVQQFNSLSAAHASLTSIFDYNQSVYKQQVSNIASSADAAKATSASKSPTVVFKTMDDKDDKANVSLSEQNAELRKQLHEQKLRLDQMSENFAKQGHSVTDSKAKAVSSNHPPRKAFYIPMIIVISLVIIALLIFVFPLFKF